MPAGLKLLCVLKILKKKKLYDWHFSQAMRVNILMKFQTATVVWGSNY